MAAERTPTEIGARLSQRLVAVEQSSTLRHQPTYSGHGSLQALNGRLQPGEGNLDAANVFFGVGDYLRRLVDQFIAPRFTTPVPRSIHRLFGVRTQAAGDP
jgi:hypothetical protein